MSATDRTQSDERFDVLDPMARLVADEWSSGWWSVYTEDGRAINGASVEGTTEELRALARAIRERTHYTERRCAVDARPETGDAVYLWSPRNSTTRTKTTRAQADAFASWCAEGLTEEGAL